MEWLVTEFTVFIIIAPYISTDMLKYFLVFLISLFHPKYDRYVKVNFQNGFEVIYDRIFQLKYI